MSILKAIFDLIRREPVMSVALVVAAMELLAAFGIHLQGPQVAAIKAFAEVVVGIMVRSQVSPTVSLPKPPV